MMLKKKLFELKPKKSLLERLKKKKELSREELSKKQYQMTVGAVATGTGLEFAKRIPVPERYEGLKQTGLTMAQAGVGVLVAWKGLKLELEKLRQERRKYEGIIKEFRQKELPTFTYPGYLGLKPAASREKLQMLRANEESFIKTLNVCGNKLCRELLVTRPGIRILGRVFKKIVRLENTKDVLRLVKKANPEYFKLLSDHAYSLQVSGLKVEKPQIKTVNEALGKILKASRELGYEPKEIRPEQIPKELPFLIYSDSMYRHLPKQPEKRGMMVAKCLSAWLGSVSEPKKRIIKKYT